MKQAVVTAGSIASLWLLLVSPAGAATFTVDRADDAGAASSCDESTPADCSLRGAILAANALDEASTIDVPAGTYALTEPNDCYHVTAQFGAHTVYGTTALCVARPMTIVGAGAETTIVDASQTAPAFLVGNVGPVEIQGVTVRNGSFTGGSLFGHGGAVNNAGDLTLTDCVLSSNVSGASGGAIYNSSKLALHRTTVSANAAGQEGGGIFNAAFFAETEVAIVDSIIRDNYAGNIGGGLFNYYGRVEIEGTTLRDNTAANLGGGIGSYGTLTVSNSTITGNANLWSYGGGLWNGAGSAALHNVTVAHNDAGLGVASGIGGGIANTAGATLALHNSIVAGNAASYGIGVDCYDGGGQSTITSGGHNVLGVADDECTLSGDVTGNATNVDALIAAPGANGGPTETIALLPGSPAVDAGDPGGCRDARAAVLEQDQRGSVRPVDGDGDGEARCDVGAFELASGLAIESVRPGEGGRSGPLLVLVHGAGFQQDAALKLVRAGEADVVGTGARVDEAGQSALATFDLSGRALGAWDVVVTNPDGTFAAAPAAFVVAEPRAPDVWIDLVGPRLIRATFPARYLILYGNRGNTDAFAVPIILGVAESVEVTPRFEIAPPPKQLGKIVVQEWGRYYQQIVTGEGPPLNQLTLLVPVVPAGFSGALEVILYAPGDAIGRPFDVRLERGDPLFDGAPRPDAIAELVQGARDKCERLYGYTIPTAVDADLTAYMSAQIATVVSEGVAALVGSVGARPKVYSLTQLAYDLASFGLVWAQLHSPVAMASLDPPQGGAAETMGWLPSLADVATGIASLCVPEAHAQLSCVCGAIPKGVGATCCEGCSCPSGGDKEPAPPPKPCLAELGKVSKGDDDCKRPRTPKECLEIGFEVVYGKDAAGNDVAICTNNRKCAFPNSLAPSICIKFPVDPRISHDPNDKSGPAGAGSDGFITTAAPLTYTIRFENQPSATAPAAGVVITDQLDPALVDLSTLSLGPIAFGDTQVVPPPGLSEFTTDVDLRPGNDLVVRVEARLDPATSVLTWRFTSLDPDTLETPEDPLAGFLPPNLEPPQGDGYVLFTVAPHPDLPTGAEIRNQARIVFDLNPPIDTPVWRNTIDVTPPTSGVTSVTSAGSCSPEIDVAWAGSDAGSGVGAFDVLVSEDGGPFVPWLGTDATAATFPGKWGRSYAFRTVAEDRAGNRQESPSAPSQTVTAADCGPYDLAVTRIAAARTVKLRDRSPAQRKIVKVTIQNRSAVAQRIGDAATLAQLVTLTAESLGSCPAPRVELRDGKPQKALPRTVKPKQKLDVAFDVIFDCANDPATGPGHADVSLAASVHQAALGGIDADPADDVCPRRVSPPATDPFPNGSILDRGCGARQADRALGGAVLVDVALAVQR